MHSLTAARQSQLLFLLSLALVFAVNTDALAFVLGKWLELSHGTYNHGLLLLGMSLYLLYKKVDFSQIQVETRSLWAGGLLSAAFVLGAFFMGLLSLGSPQLLLVYLSVFSLILFYFGWPVLRRALVPLGLLVFALPFWDLFGGLLQYITLQVSHALVKLSGVPAIKEGFVVVIPAGRFEVAPSCSGISYFLAAAALGVSYAELNYHSRKARAIVIGGMVAAAIVANWIRVYVVIMAGELSNMQHPLVNDHFNLGWMIFGGFFILLLMIFRRWLPDEPQAQSATRHQTPARALSPAAGPPKQYAVILLGFLVILGVARLTIDAGSAGLEETDGLLSDQLALDEPVYRLGTLYRGASEHYYLRQNDAGKVQIYHAVYARQTQGRELINDLNRNFDAARWTKVSESVQPLHGKEVKVIRLRSLTDGKPVIVWFWYRVAGKVTTSALWAKWYQLQGMLQGNNRAEVILLCTTPQARDLLSQTAERLLESSIERQ